MSRFFLLLVFLVHPLCSEEIYLLCAPGSGKHWLSYCISQMTGRELIINRGINQYNPYKKLQKDFDRGFVYAASNPKALWITKESVDNDILISIIRNYREVLVRKFKETDDVILDLIKQEQANNYDDRKYACYTSPYNHYMNNLRCFDKWGEKKFLVYYEDLMEKPEETLRELALFLGDSVDTEKFEDLIGQLEQHSNQSLEIFSKRNRSQEVPESLLHYSEQIGVADCVKIDTVVESLFPYYFEKYLKRYEWAP